MILGKPDPPTDVKVLNVTDSSVILTWSPGFDGGLAQQFNIRYYVPALGNRAYLYADAPSAPFTVGG